VAVYTLGLLRSVARPKCPKDEIGPTSHGEQREPVDAAVLADPVPNLHVIGMGILGESSAFGLFGGEESLLLLGDLKEPSRRFSMRLSHAQNYNFLDVISSATRR